MWSSLKRKTDNPDKWEILFSFVLWCIKIYEVWGFHSSVVWGFMSFGMLDFVVGWVVPDTLKDHNAFIFEGSGSQASSTASHPRRLNPRMMYSHNWVPVVFSVKCVFYVDRFVTLPVTCTTQEQIPCTGFIVTFLRVKPLL